MGSDGPHGQHITSGRLQRDNLLVEGGARLRARATYFCIRDCLRKYGSAPASSIGDEAGARTCAYANELLSPLAHARQDAAAQRDGRLGDRITFRESRQAASTKEHTSGQLPITLEAIEKHGIKYQDHK